MKFRFAIFDFRFWDGEKSRPSREAAIENSPPIYRWVSRQPEHPVPPGTTDTKSKTTFYSHIYEHPFANTKLH